MNAALVCAFLRSDSRIPRLKSTATWRTRKQTGSFEGELGGGGAHWASQIILSRVSVSPQCGWHAVPFPCYKGTLIPPLLKKKEKKNQALPVCVVPRRFALRTIEGRATERCFPSAVTQARWGRRLLLLLIRPGGRTVSENPLASVARTQRPISVSNRCWSFFCVCVSV